MKLSLDLESEDPMPMPCTAEAALTEDEVRALNALPGADFEVDTKPLGCDFGVHGSEAQHTVCAQMQYESSGLVLWWLFWDDEGGRELRIAPGCKKVVVSEACLLVEDHHGTCDQSIGLTREELAAEFPRSGSASG